MASGKDTKSGGRDNTAKKPGQLTTAQKAQKEKREATIKALREFAKIYNDYKGCPLMHDLIRVLYSGDAKRAKRFGQDVTKYRRWRKTKPELQLPELILRNRDGSMIAVPQGVLDQLQIFRIDPARIKKAKGFIVTSAQFGALVNKDVWAALKRYADYLGYALIVMPIKYGAVKTVYQAELQSRVLTSTFDPLLEGHMVFEDLELVEGTLNLNVFRMRPTLTKFLPPKVLEQGGDVSQIFAAPMLELAYSMRVDHDYPKASMTTGAVTYPNYNVDNLGQQDRTGEIAAASHTFSAIIIESSAPETFHFRQLLSTREGEFYDIDPKRGGAIYVTPDAIEHRPNDVCAAYLGDWHTGKTHPDVRELTFKTLLPLLSPDHIITGDFFDGESIAHWEDKQASRRAFKGPRQLDNLRAELDALVAEAEWMRECMPDAEHHTVASNHNEFLQRNIQDLRYQRDDTNLAIGSKLFVMLQEDMDRREAEGLMEHHMIAPTDPINLWLRTHAPFMHAHGRKSKLLLPEKAKPANQVLMSLHGDVGPGGQRKASLESHAKWNKRVFIGHSHAPAIFGPVWRVGTSGHLMEHYISTPSTSWMHTHGLLFANGQRMLINLCNGTFHGQTRRRSKSAGLRREGEKQGKNKKSSKSKKG